MCASFKRKEGIDYISNFYRYNIYDKESGKYLITVDDGNYLFLNRSALRQLKRGKIEDEQIFELLTEKGVIVTENNFNKIVEKTKQRYSFLENGTSLHIVIPTYRCNLSCTYCFASACHISAPRDENDMDERTAKKVIEFIMKSPSDAITIEFQGGEPLARFDIVQVIVKEAKRINDVLRKDLRLAIVSNFTMMNDEIANWLIDEGVSFCTSFDGPKEVHDKNRYILGKDDIEVGTHSQVKYWIKRINELYEKRGIKGEVNALMTITKHSLKYHKEILDEYINLGLYLVDIRSLTEVGRVIDNKESITYPYDDFLRFYKKSIDYIDEVNKRGIPVVERVRELFYTKVIDNVPTYHTEYDSPCGAATGQITYFNDGSIYTCNEALGRDEFKIGNVFKEAKWQNIFKKREVSKAILNSMLEQNVRCDRCAYKPYCSTCMVENYYKDNKFNFYPTKTLKHYETIYQCRKLFDKVLDDIK